MLSMWTVLSYYPCDGWESEQSSVESRSTTNRQKFLCHCQTWKNLKYYFDSLVPQWARSKQPQRTAYRIWLLVSTFPGQFIEDVNFTMIWIIYARVIYIFTTASYIRKSEWPKMKGLPKGIFGTYNSGWWNHDGYEFYLEAVLTWHSEVYNISVTFLHTHLIL